MVLFIDSGSSEAHSVCIGELKLFSEVLLPGLVQDNLVGLNRDSE